MRLLIIGGGGQLGNKIIHLAKKKDHEVFATYVSRPPPLDEQHKFFLDKRDKKKIIEIARQVKPKAIIDTAAIHNVDYCESNKEEAWAVNVEGTKNVTMMCKSLSAKMVFISTDYVFDGTKGNYSEHDQPNPANFYGSTKFEAEKAVSDLCKNHIIARTSVIYSWLPSNSTLSSASGKPLNFAMWVIQKLSKGESINVVDDQYSSPTLADILADALIRAIEKDIVGLYHIAGKTKLSRFELTLKLAGFLNLRKDLVVPIKTSDLRQLARRPFDSSLDPSKAEHDMKMTLPVIDEALKIFALQTRS